MLVTSLFEPLPCTYTVLPVHQLHHLGMDARLRRCRCRTVTVQLWFDVPRADAEDLPPKDVIRLTLVDLVAQSAGLNRSVTLECGRPNATRLRRPLDIGNGLGNLMARYLVHECLSLLWIPRTFPSSSGCASMPVVLHYVLALPCSSDGAEEEIFAQLHVPYDADRRWSRCALHSADDVLPTKM